ncbi:MAG: hypothetical protein K2O37_07020, partial [Bacteroidales bacterium]|nr:hypothetical protein [Bacteroidales bacterium]
MRIYSVFRFLVSALFFTLSFLCFGQGIDWQSCRKGCATNADMDIPRDFDFIWIINDNAKIIINWGSLDLTRYRMADYANCSALKITNTSQRVLFFFNFGRVSKAILMPEETTKPIVSFCFNDKNLAPDVQLPTKGANVYNLESRQLIDSAFMRNLMGNEGAENFIFEDGFYPRFKIGETRCVASPILLYPGENADSVVHSFYVDTNY